MEENDSGVLISYEENMIREKIYTIRGMQVMLDRDLAELYQVETRILNQAVKRNSDRFPKRFMFQLTEEENQSLISQIVISKIESGRGGIRKMPFAFTESGIAMLSAVLRSDIAVNVSLKIMDTFVEMRKFIANNSIMFEKISAVELKQLEYKKETDKKFEEVFEYIHKNEEIEQKIFFAGQIYDAFSLITDIIKKAKIEIILIDNYVDLDTLNILKNKNENVKIVIYTLSNTTLSAADIKKFNAQYKNLSIKHTDKFHDRFLILDKIKCYHVGASIKDAGKKAFGINILEDISMINEILKKV